MVLQSWTWHLYNSLEIYGQLGISIRLRSAGIMLLFLSSCSSGLTLPAKVQWGGASSPLPAPWSLVPSLMLSPCDLAAPWQITDVWRCVWLRSGVSSYPHTLQKMGLRLRAWKTSIHAFPSAFYTYSFIKKKSLKPHNPNSWVLYDPNRVFPSWKHCLSCGLTLYLHPN